jgi:tetratricopeptide (TPR) repeat protein
VVAGGEEQPSAYLELVTRYRAGDREKAVHDLLERDPTEGKALMDRIMRVRQETGSYGPDDDCLRAASLLETEAGMERARRREWDRADERFRTGWGFSNVIATPALGDRFRRDWLLVAGLFFQDRIYVGSPSQSYSRAAEYLQEASRRYPDDVEVLLAAGAVLEWSGSLREGPRSDLKRAEALYAQALRIDPDNPEALLRHGWVLKKLGKTKEAEAPLRRVLVLTSDSNLIYRSRMALGAVAESSGRLDEAASDYEAAAGAEPTWRVAYLAWSEALHRKGANARAREVLDRPLEAVREGWHELEVKVERSGVDVRARRGYYYEKEK